MLGTGGREAARNRGERDCSEQLTEKALRAGKGEGAQGGRGCFGRKREKLFKGPVPDAHGAFDFADNGRKFIEARSRRARSFRSVARVRRDTRSGGAVGWGSSRRFEAVGDLLHRIGTTVKQEVRVILIVGTSCPKAGLPRNRATRCGADRSVSEGYGEEGWSHRG